MSQVRGRSVIALLAALVCSIVGLAWRNSSLSAGATGPVGTKMVYLDGQLRSDPVSYIEVTTEGLEIQPGISAAVFVNRPAVPFQADEDWLKNMLILLLNRTDKEIVCADIDFMFPDAGDGSPSRPVVEYHLTLGQRPEVDAFNSRGRKIPPNPAKQPLSFSPGQTLTIHVGDYIEEIGSVVEQKLPLSQISKLAVRRRRFYFSDGMIWDDLRSYGIPDPNHPGQFAFKQRGSYFPGHPSENWPPPTQQFEAGRHTTN